MQGDVKETGSGTLKMSRFGPAKRIFQEKQKKRQAQALSEGDLCTWAQEKRRATSEM